MARVRLKRTFTETKKVKVVKALSTKNSTFVHVNHHAVVIFLRKVNEVEFYYKGIKYNFSIDNDKEVLEIGEKAIAELVENYLKEHGEKVIDEATGDIVLKGTKKKGRKVKKATTEKVEEKKTTKRGRKAKVEKTVEVKKEGKKRGRPAKVKEETVEVKEKKRRGRPKKVK